VAGENSKNPRIVILSEKDKVEMEDEIREKIPNMKNMKVICRSGSPNDLTNLAMVNPHEAKSIIVLSPEEGNADSQTIKTILAITNNPERKSEPYHIIAEIKDFKNLEVAKMVGKDEVELILTDDIFARIMVQTSRQSGLSMVYQELMDFDGAEIYFAEEPKLTGKTFADAVFSYESSAVMGLQYANGECVINPPMDYVLQKGDKVIAITEDDDTLIVSGKTGFAVNEDAIVNLSQEPLGPEKTLILGWNYRGEILIREMDQYVAKGSFIKIVSDYEIEEEEQNRILSSMQNARVEFLKAEVTSREVIDSLEVTSFDNVQVLCYEDTLEQQEADAITLIILLHLRRISSEQNVNLKIVSEMLDIRNRDLASVTKVDDFIVSDKLISLMMSQVSENKHLMRVFEDLLRSEGSEIYLKPAANYVKTGVEVNFYTIVESAKRKGEIAIGYKIAALSGDSSQAFGVCVNPDKRKMIAYTADDKIIVLAEDL
jgi:voltage-gated potassium channel Kch